MDTGIVRVEYKELELKLKTAGAMEMDTEIMIVMAQNKVLELKLERSEKGAKRRIEDECRKSKRVKVELGNGL